MIRYSEMTQQALDKILGHEGGFVDHPDDPGGATNKGITIGTLRRLGIDVDGDGDSDIHDLKSLTDDDVRHVFKTMYWDAVQADQLPPGVNYTVADFAVNSGPARAARALQSVVGVEVDGVIGPKTIAAAHAISPITVIHKVNDYRMAFLQRLRVWPTFKNGWTRRVTDVREVSLKWARATPPGGVVAPPFPGAPAAVAQARRTIAELEKFIKAMEVQT